MTRPEATPPGPGTAAVQRMTGRLLGLLVVLTAPAWGHSALYESPSLAGWWNALAAVLVVAPAAWLAVVSFAGREVRVPVVVLSAGVAVMLLLWPAGVVDVEAAAAGLPWLWLVFPMSMAALATLGSIPLSLVYSAAVGVVYAAIRLEPIGGSGPPPVVVLEVFLVVSLAVGPTILVVGASRSAARLDAIAAAAARASADASQVAAAVATRQELDAVVHDTVLAALHTAVRDPGSPEVPLLAERALGTFRSPAPQRPEPGRSVSVVELAGRLQSSLAAVAPEADLEVRGGTAVPPAVARAVVDAALEVARNARRHGGGAGAAPDITVVVEGLQDGGGVQVTVSDDGVGFDPSLVPPHRMGLAVSVRERVRRVGGTVRVVTAPGSGTTVVLRWHPAGPEAAG